MTSLRHPARYAALAALAAPTLLAIPASAYDGGTRLCRFADSRIGESSGVAVASFDDRLVWTHNDSGDAARWFLVDTTTCATVATYRLDLPQPPPVGGESATAIDWEDMARGVNAAGAPTLLFGDIGDNYQARSTVTVYEVLEPAGTLPAGGTPADEQPVAVEAVHDLVYPSGPRDAETLLFVPQTRQLAVVTKPRDAAQGLAYTGRSEVYVAAPGLPATSGAVPLTKAADIDFTTLPRRDATVPESYAASGGDVADDGRRLVVRTYFEAYEWTMGPDYDLGAAITAGPPLRIPLLDTKQGEAIAYANDGTTLVTTSEGSGTDGNARSGAVDTYRGAAAPPAEVPEGWPVLLAAGGTLAAGVLAFRRRERVAS